jgi:hypothetical protein
MEYHKPTICHVLNATSFQGSHWPHQIFNNSHSQHQEPNNFKTEEKKRKENKPGVISHIKTLLIAVLNYYNIQDSSSPALAAWQQMRNNTIMIC